MRKTSSYTALLNPTHLLISEKSATYTIKWSYTIIWQKDFVIVSPVANFGDQSLTLSKVGFRLDVLSFDLVFFFSFWLCFVKKSLKHTRGEEI